MSNTDVQNRNVNLVHSALDNALAGRLDLVEPLFADDFILYEAEGLPFGGIYRGWQGYTEILRKLREFWTSGRKQVSRQFIPYGDDKVIIDFTIDGRIAKNGQHVEMPIVAIWQLKGGKIATIRVFFFDTKRIADLAAM